MNDAPLSHAETLMLLAQVKTGGETGEAAMEQLMCENAPLVRSIVRKFIHRGTEYEDLYQIGCIGLMKAVRNFDPAFNVRFSTYAVPMIMGEIKRFLRDDGMIKVSRSHKELAARVAKAQESLSFSLGREPDLVEIAAMLEVSSEDVVLCLEAVRPHVSLSTPVCGEESEVSLADRLETGCDEATLAIDRVVLKNALSQLTPRERQIIIQRYFLDKTQGEIAKSLGVSQVQVSRLETRIIEKLRKSV